MSYPRDTQYVSGYRMDPTFSNRIHSPYLQLLDYVGQRGGNGARESVPQYTNFFKFEPKKGFFDGECGSAHDLKAGQTGKQAADHPDR